MTRVLKKIHGRICGDQQEGFRLFKKLIYLGYYLPNMEADIASFAERVKPVNSIVTEFTLPQLNFIVFIHFGQLTHRSLI